MSPAEAQRLPALPPAIEHAWDRWREAHPRPDSTTWALFVALMGELTMQAKRLNALEDKITE